MGTLLGRKVYQPSPGRIMFFCPGCNTGHAIVVDGSRGWTWNGDGEKPTVSPSILCTGKRRITDEEHTSLMAGERVDIPDLTCHSFVRDGRWEFLGDCTHELASQSVDVPDWPHGPNY